MYMWIYLLILQTVSTITGDCDWLRDSRGSPNAVVILRADTENIFHPRKEANTSEDCFTEVRRGTHELPIFFVESRFLDEVTNHLAFNGSPRNNHRASFRLANLNAWSVWLRWPDWEADTIEFIC